MLCDQITCVTSSEIKWPSDHHVEKPEHFLPGVKLLQAKIEWLGLCCPSVQRQQLHIRMEQNSFEGGGITCQQYFYYHPFTQLLSTKDKPRSLRTATNGVSGQGSKTVNIFTRFLQSRCPYNIPTIRISQATLLLSTAPSGSKEQRFETSVLGNPRIPNQLLPSIFKLYWTVPTSVEETHLLFGGDIVPNMGIPNKSSTYAEEHVQTQQASSSH